jgi:hypothetical protein
VKKTSFTSNVERNWRADASRLQHVTWVGSCTVIGILYLLVQSNCIELQPSVNVLVWIEWLSDYSVQQQYFYYDALRQWLCAARPLTGSLFITKLIWVNKKRRQNDSSRRPGRKKLSPCQFVHQKSSMDWTEREPGSLRGKKAAPNRMSCGTSLSAEKVAWMFCISDHAAVCQRDEWRIGLIPHPRQ